MPNKNKRKRKEDRPRPTIHPRNKYSDNPPDFTHLASLYPSFKPFVFYSRDGRPRIDWTDFNATRELTRILLLHDHGIDWWIPDGQLCPTVPNRSNYINWIEDLLSSEIIPKTSTDSVRGFDIGTGANCIYPLLGASLLGWSFLGSDVTDVALEWAERNVKSNPHVSDLIEIRRVGSCKDTFPNMEPHNSESVNDEKETDVGVGLGMEVESETLPSSSFNPSANADNCYCGPPILLGVIKDDEKFDFCMCNPPFFESMEEAGLNPKTSCGGTPEEMICPGGEKAFIIRIIEDSVALKQSIRWYTSMVGRKSNLKFLISKLHKVGVTIVKTTEFVQGQTSRWGLAWSFVPPAWKLISAHITQKNNLSFMLEGLHPQFSAIHVLRSIESFFRTSGASCKLNDALFSLDISASNDHCNAILKDDGKCIGAATSSEHMQEISDGSSLHSSSSNLCFRISVFQQIPGTLLVKGSLQHRDSSLSGLFSPIFQQLEELLKSKICR